MKKIIATLLISALVSAMTPGLAVAFENLYTSGGNGTVSAIPTLDQVTTAGNTTANGIDIGDGSLSAPSYSFNNDTNTGFYRVGTDQLGLSAGGFNVLTASSTGASVSGTLALPLGSNSAPSVSFGQANTGIYSSSLGSALAYTVNGTARIVMDTAALRPATDNALTLGTTALRFSTGNFATVSSSVLLVDRGAAATPSVRLGDADTGLYNNSGLVAITSDGTLAAQFANTGSYMNSHLLTQTPNTYDLGSTSWTWRDAYIARNGYFGTSGARGGVTSTTFGDNLQVALTLINSDVGVDDGPGIDFRWNGAGTQLGARVGMFPQNTGTGDLAFFTNNANSLTEKMRILANGNIGIGIKSPTSTLEVAGRTSSTSLVVSTAVTTTGAIFYAPNLNALGATGDFLCQNNTTGYVEVQLANCTVSSIRFKEHVESMSTSEMMEKTRKLRAVMFDYRNGDKGMLGTVRDQGFIAEEVAVIDPYLVVWEEATLEGLQEVSATYPDAVMEIEGKKFIPKTVDYAKVSVILTGAIQDLDARLQAVEKRTGFLDKLLNLFN